MKKKSFTESNPALAFITADPEPQAERQQLEGYPATPPAGYKLNPLYVETKSKRVNLLLQPSLAAQIKAAAVEEGKSVNEMITEAIRAFLKARERK